MKRREFIQNTALFGAAAGLMGSSLCYAMRGVGKNIYESSSIFLQEKENRNKKVYEILNSTLVINGLDPSVLNERYLTMLQRGGVNCWHITMGGLESFSAAYNFVDEHGDSVAVATTAEDIIQAYKENKIALIFGWQYADELVDIRMASDLPPFKTNLRAFYELGLRITGLAYNVTNYFCGGNVDADIGLTSYGRRLVEEIHSLGIILDVGGHMSEKAAFEALEISKGKTVICSHTNVRAINDNLRCISDRLIEAIAKTGGVIGISAINDFHVRNKSHSHTPVSPQTTLEKHLDQYDYVRKLVGVDHVGLAPDFVEGSSPIPIDQEINEVIWPAESASKGPILYVKGFEDITQLPNVVVGLMERGWSSSDIHKLLGENWLIVYEKVWGS